jgi:hypothetical protein
MEPERTRDDADMTIDPLSRGLMERAAARLQEGVALFFRDGTALPAGPGDCPLCRWIAYLRETLSPSSLEEEAPVPAAHRRFHLSLEEARSFREADPGRLLWFLAEAETAGEETARSLPTLS